VIAEKHEIIKKIKYMYIVKSTKTS